MVRNGDYCIYKGREFKVNRDMEGNLLVLSHDPQLVNEGFEDIYNSGLYSKKVKSNDLSNCFSVYTKGKIDGEIVNISQENEFEYYVGTSNSDIAKKLGLERTDKYYYESWVQKDRVEVFEEREEIEP